MFGAQDWRLIQAHLSPLLQVSKCTQRATSSFPLNSDGIGCIIRAMQHALSQHAIQKAACRVLSHLAHNSTENKIKICELGGIDAILAAMRAHPDRARNQVCPQPMYAHACRACNQACQAWGSVASEMPHPRFCFCVEV